MVVNMLALLYGDPSWVIASDCSTSRGRRLLSPTCQIGLSSLATTFVEHSFFC